MYESFFGLKDKPFTLLPDPEYLYLSPKHQRALTLLEYGVMNQAGFSVICGDTGAGKTTLIRRLLSELTDDTTVGLITNTHRSFGELLNWVLMAFGMDAEGKTKSQMHHMFIEFLVTQYAKNKHTILIVDEAQNMEAETLEELRMLSNINADKDQVLQVILAGQPALRDTLRKPELRQFAQRISVDYYLEALNRDETALYIHHRLKVAGAETQIFTADACNAIHGYSGGTPRLINLLCDTSLVYGFAEQLKTIDSRLVDEVVREQHSNSILPTFNAPHAANPQVTNAGVDAVIADLGDRARKAVSEAREMPEKASTEKLVDEFKTVSKNEEAPCEKDLVNETRTQDERVDEVNAEPAATVGEVATPVMSDVNSNKADVIDKARSNTSEQDQYRDETKRVEARIEKDDFEEVYPIVRVEERPNKASTGSVLFVGIASGMLVATLALIVVAYVVFGDAIKGAGAKDAVVAPTKQVQDDIEQQKLEALAKERDAALALTKALERERDAAVTAAKVQEEIRKAEQRAAELIAEQERKTAMEVMRERKKAKQAEYEVARAKERERLAIEEAAHAKMKAEELLKKKLEEEARIAAEKVAMTPQIKEVKEVKEVVVKSAVLESRQLVDETANNYFERKVEKKNVEPVSEFSANPCKSPSAKFLSTCKK